MSQSELVEHLAARLAVLKLTDRQNEVFLSLCGQIGQRKARSREDVWEEWLGRLESGVSPGTVLAEMLEELERLAALGL